TGPLLPHGSRHTLLHSGVPPTRYTAAQELFIPDPHGSCPNWDPGADRGTRAEPVKDSPCSSDGPATHWSVRGSYISTPLTERQLASCPPAASRQDVRCDRRRPPPSAPKTRQPLPRLSIPTTGPTRFEASLKPPLILSAPAAAAIGPPACGRCVAASTSPHGARSGAATP
ncbi:hypothetical protein Vretifemale_4758, partial [Volvox reticuliferus]